MLNYQRVCQRHCFQWKFSNIFSGRTSGVFQWVPVEFSTISARPLHRQAEEFFFGGLGENDHLGVLTIERIGNGISQWDICVEILLKYQRLFPRF